MGTRSSLTSTYPVRGSNRSCVGSFTNMGATPVESGGGAGSMLRPKMRMHLTEPRERLSLPDGSGTRFCTGCVGQNATGAIPTDPSSLQGLVRMSGRKRRADHPRSSALDLALRRRGCPGRRGATAAGAAAAGEACRDHEKARSGRRSPRARRMAYLPNGPARMPSHDRRTLPACIHGAASKIPHLRRRLRRNGLHRRAYRARLAEIRTVR